MRMSFKIEMDRPIIKGTHYISPGGYCLRFWLGNGKCKDIDFDFMDYEGTIVDGNFLECSVEVLDTESFSESSYLVNYLKNYAHDWVEFFVYTGEHDESVINPVKVSNIVFNTGSESYKLKDYVFTDNVEIVLSDYQFNALSSIMDRPLKFCKNHPLMSKDSYIKFYERNARIYLCTASGVGYYYDTRTGVTGSIHCSGGVEAAKGVILDILQRLNRLINFPVKSISVTNGAFSHAYCSKSTEEEGTYDITLK